jgi:hypothetical protein
MDEAAVPAEEPSCATGSGPTMVPAKLRPSRQLDGFLMPSVRQSRESMCLKTSVYIMLLNLLLRFSHFSLVICSETGL